MSSSGKKKNAHPPRPRKEVVQRADLGSKRAFVHHLLQVLYRLSTQDSSATWLTTGKHLLNRNRKTIKSSQYRRFAKQHRVKSE